jgi:hypothetical protein
MGCKMLFGVMQNTRDELNRAKERLCSEKSHQHWDYHALVNHLEKLTGMFSLTSPDQNRDLIAQFHDCAGKLPYAFDQDFGALVLEDAALQVENQDLRSWFLIEARYRANWCAQAGTAGGECIARYQHVKRLEESLRNRG